MTIPFSTMRFVEVDPFDSISHEKWKAIRELHYMPATKIEFNLKVDFGKNKDN
ncbi:FAD-dependent oxidoreductase [Bacillus pacificus]